MSKISLSFFFLSKNNFFSFFRVRGRQYARTTRKNKKQETEEMIACLAQLKAENAILLARVRKVKGINMEKLNAILALPNFPDSLVALAAQNDLMERNKMIWERADLMSPPVNSNNSGTFNNSCSSSNNTTTNNLSIGQVASDTDRGELIVLPLKQDISIPFAAAPEPSNNPRNNLMRIVSDDFSNGSDSPHHSSQDDEMDEDRELERSLCLACVLKGY